jgi:hypothetical protein
VGIVSGFLTSCEDELRSERSLPDVSLPGWLLLEADSDAGDPSPFSSRLFSAVYALLLAMCAGTTLECIGSDLSLASRNRLLGSGVIVSVVTWVLPLACADGSTGEDWFGRSVRQRREVESLRSPRPSAALPFCKKGIWFHTPVRNRKWKLLPDPELFVWGIKTSLKVCCTVETSFDPSGASSS